MGFGGNAPMMMISLQMATYTARNVLRRLMDGVTGPGHAGDVLRATRWSILARAGAHLFQLIGLLAAMRMLEPRSVGVYILAYVGFQFVQSLSMSGWREFVLGWRGESKGVDQASGFAFLAGYLAAAIVLICALPIGGALNSPSLSIVLVAFSCSLLLAPMTEVHATILFKSKRYRTAAGIELGAEAVGLALVLASLGMGVGIVSLAIGVAGRSLTHFFLAMAASPRRRSIRFNGGAAKAIRGVVFERLHAKLVAFFNENTGTLVAGVFLGPVGAAVFKCAERIAGTLAEVVYEPIRLLTWILFRRSFDMVADDMDMLEQIERKSKVFFPIVLASIAPFFIGMALISEQLVAVALGPNWSGVAVILPMLAIAKLLGLPHIFSAPLLTLTGRADRLPIYEIIGVLVLVAATALLAAYGVTGVAIGTIVASAYFLSISVWLQWRFANANWGNVIKTGMPAYSALAALACAVLTFRIFLPETIVFEPIISLLGSIAIGAVAYLGMAALTGPRFFRTLSL